MGVEGPEAYQEAGSHQRFEESLTNIMIDQGRAHCVLGAADLSDQVQ